MEGHIFTEDIIDENYPKLIKEQVQRLGNVTSIVHHISSPGGDCYAGYKAYGFLMNLGIPIKPVIEGEAQSMATFMALAGDDSEIQDPSVWMIHNPRMNTGGDADALAGGSSELRKIEDSMAQAYFEKNQRSAAKNPTVKKLTLEQVKTMMKNETHMSAQEAVMYGFVDRIASTKPLKITNATEYQHLKAVALGTEKKMEGENKSVLDKIQEGLTAILTKISPPAEGATTADATPAPVVTPPAPAPKSLDLALKDGSMLTVMTENGDLVGKTATVNGSPAPDGTHDLGDGRQIVISGGVITEVMEPETPEQKAIREANQKLVAAEAEKQALQAQAEQAKKDLEQKAAALAAVKTEVEKLKNETVGSDEPIRPAAFAKNMENKEEKLKIYASRTFIVNNFPSWERKYKGKFEDGTSWDSYRTGGPNAVSILETNFNYTYNGVLTDEIFYKPSLSSPALSDIFTIDTDASDKKRYNLLNPLSKVLLPYTGCGGTPAGNRSLITNTTIQLKPFQMYESWCKDDFTGQLTGSFNVLAENWLRTGNASFDPAGTPIDRIIVDALKDALRRDVFRRVSFAASNSADADYNQIDGLWDRLIDSSGASNYCVYRYGSGLGTGTLADGTANTYLTGMWENSNLLLKEYGIDNGRARFLVTRSIWDNYYKYLVGVGAVTEQAYSNYVSGLNTLTFRGIPVIPVSLWDSFLAESDNPLFATTRHLALLTVKDNHILGVENTSDLEKIDSWYEQKDQKRYYRANMTFGYQYLHCDLQTIAY